jgi:hypothetical protein
MLFWMIVGFLWLLGITPSEGASHMHEEARCRALSQDIEAARKDLARSEAEHDKTEKNKKAVWERGEAELERMTKEYKEAEASYTEAYRKYMEAEAIKNRKHDEAQTVQTAFREKCSYIRPKLSRSECGKLASLLAEASAEHGRLNENVNHAMLDNGAAKERSSKALATYNDESKKIVEERTAESNKHLDAKNKWDTARMKVEALEKDYSGNCTIP